MISLKMPAVGRRGADCEAFTLLEVVISLVLLGIVAAMLVTFLGRVMERSSGSAISLGEAYDLQRALEGIRSAGSTNTLSDLSAMIGPEGAEMDNAFGTYRVVHNRPVRFSGGVEIPEPGGTNFLKVTIGSMRGELLTLVMREKM